MRLYLGITNRTFIRDRLELDLFHLSVFFLTGALALLLLASSGKTFSELSTVLGSSSDDFHEKLAGTLRNIQTDGDVRLNFATGLFVQKDFDVRDDYKEFVEKVYGSEVVSVDFGRNAAGAQRVVNEWVEGKTQKKIRNILPEPPSDATKVVVASTLYFKAKWEKPFFEHGSRRLLVDYQQQKKS